MQSQRPPSKALSMSSCPNRTQHSSPADRRGRHDIRGSVCSARPRSGSGGARNGAAEIAGEGDDRRPNASPRAGSVRSSISRRFRHWPTGDCNGTYSATEAFLLGSPPAGIRSGAAASSGPDDLFTLLTTRMGARRMAQSEMREIRPSGQKIALIAGGGPGISASCAKLFRESGMRVAVAARNPDKGALLTLEKTHAVRRYVCDASHPAAVELLFQDVVRDLGCAHAGGAQHRWPGSRNFWQEDHRSRPGHGAADTSERGVQRVLGGSASGAAHAGRMSPRPTVQKERSSSRTPARA